MRRIVCLALAGILLSSVGCQTYWRVGEHRPPWPQALTPDAYADVQPTVETPDIVGGHVAIAGGRIDDHGLYIDVLVEAPDNEEAAQLTRSISGSAHFAGEPEDRWFTLIDSAGQEVRVLARERPRYKGWFIPMFCFFPRSPDVLSAAPGLIRRNIVVWFHTESQLAPGPYTLVLPDARDEYPGLGRQMLGLEAFHNTPIELRYAAGYEPDGADN